MKYEKLEKYISILVNQDLKVNKAYDAGVDIMDFADDYHLIIKMMLEEILTPEGINWLEWFIWEKGAITGELNKDLDAWDENGNPICQDLKGLYEHLVTNNYFKIKS